MYWFYSFVSTEWFLSRRKIFFKKKTLLQLDRFWELVFNLCLSKSGVTQALLPVCQSHTISSQVSCAVSSKDEETT